MGSCNTCGCNSDTVKDGKCLACANPGHYTLPRDEWDEMSKEDQREARKKGITPEPEPGPSEDERDLNQYISRGGF